MAFVVDKHPPVLAHQPVLDNLLGYAMCAVKVDLAGVLLEDLLAHFAPK